MSAAYQPRYIAYAQAHGRNPSEQEEFDVERWPGGCMTGFILWSNQHLSRWKSLVGIASHRPLTEAQQDEYTAWLFEQAKEEDA